MIASCGTCRYFSALKRECRKNPPTAHLLPGGGGVVSMTAFPIVAESVWCGAYDAGQDHDCMVPLAVEAYIGGAWTCEVCGQVWERNGVGEWMRKVAAS